MKHNPTRNPSVFCLRATTAAEVPNSRAVAVYRSNGEAAQCEKRITSEKRTIRQVDAWTDSPVGIAGRLCSRTTLCPAGKDPANRSAGAAAAQTLSAEALNPKANHPGLTKRAAAHRAMALAALRSDSSLSARLRRYNHHISIARTIEASTQQQQTSRNPRAALAWIKAGKSIRINALNLRDQLRHVRALATLESQGGEA